MPSASVKASSWTAVEPASRMWYPLIEMVFHFGTRAVQNAIRSVMMRSEGAGGKIHSFCAMYSFRMSFWSVPSRDSSGTPWRSATARYIASRTAAGALIVMEVETLPRGMSRKSASMSARVSIATPSRPTSPSAMGSSESRPMRVGRSKAVDSPVWPCSRR